jgi:hypothetical protein
MTAIRRTRWGGLADHKLEARGYFRVEQAFGAWWLVSPDGGLFVSKGVVSVNFDHDNVRGTERHPYREACIRKYGDRTAWHGAVANRLLSWGFNTIGAWSEPEISHAGRAPLASAAGVVYLATAYGEGRGWPLCDVFDPAFESFADKRAQEICAPSRDDNNVLGWFTDNELQWGPDWRGPDDLLTIILRHDGAPFSRAVAIGLLRDRYADIAAFNLIWKTPARSWGDLAARPIGEPPFKRDTVSYDSDSDPVRQRFFADCDAFAGLVADRYMSVSVAAIKAADPNHLVLGCRIAYLPPRAVIVAAGRHFDVISLNCYAPLPDHVLDVYAASGRPCLIGEFSFRGDDVGLPNTQGAGPRVKDQAARAEGFVRYVSAGLRHPHLVGYHWFVHADQPREGRWDGEDSNYGVVTIDDDVYTELTRAMTIVNADAERLHVAAAVAMMAGQDRDDIALA